MSLELRDYQNEIYAEARAAIQSGFRAILLQSPTGSGKTVLIAKMLEHASSKGYRAFFNVHRRELVKQSVLTLSEAAGLNLGIVAAGFNPNRHELIQVCSVQTLSKRRHLLHDPQLIVWDEAHHVATATWGDIFNAYPKAVHIGLTATPERLDGTGLDAFFKKLILGPSVKTLIDSGWLSPYKLYAPSSPDLSNVHTVAGDYNKRELSAVMDADTGVVGDAVEHYKRLAMGRRAIVFMWSVESSIKMAAKFNEQGIPAAHIGGDTHEGERDRAIEDFRSGRLKILSNVEIISEGFDLPAIEAAFLLRPTRSLALYLQQVGRALRTNPGKTEALIFDHAGNCRQHGLPDDERIWSLEGRRRRRGDAAECPVKQCPKCYAMIAAASMECKWCHFKFQVMSRNVDELEGELSEVDLAKVRQQKLDEQNQAKTPEELTRLGQMRGYKNPEKWAAHILKWRGVKREAHRDSDRRAAAEARSQREYSALPKVKEWL